MPETVSANLYDFPKYYDLIFGNDWKAEFDFLLAAIDKHGLRNTRRIFEPACGTGRLLIKLAQMRRHPLREAVASALTAGRKYINSVDGFGPDRLSIAL